MRDGILLAIDIYRQANDAADPALLVRMPHDKERYVSPGMMAFVKAGYAVAVQDTRGRFASQGDFSSTVHGNDITEDDQWRKLELIVNAAQEVWGDW